MKQNSVETGFTNAASAERIPPTTTFASAPQSPATGSVYVFTDALTPGAIVGGGTSLSTCRWSGSAWVSASAGPPVTIQDEGIILTSRTTLNFVGAGVVATDDVANTRTVVTIAGGFADPTTTKGDIIARATAGPATRLGIGTDGQVLTADSAQTTGIKWATSAAAPVTSVFTRTGAVVAQSGDYSAFYVPLARQVIAGTGLTGGGALSADVTLTAKALVASGASHSAGYAPDPGVTAGTTKFLREDATWVVPAYPADAVTSVFTRTGAVVALSGDYSAFYVPLARQVIAGTGLTGGGALSADVTLTVAADTTNQRVIVSNAGTTVGTRKQINFIQGTNATLTIADDTPNNRVNVTIAATDTVGMTDPTTTKGDLIVRGTAAPATRMAVGATANQTLLVDSAQALGIKWATMTAAMVTNAVDQTGSYTNPAWIVSIPWSKVTGAPSVSSYQTPWLSDIDGAGFKLYGTGNVGIGNPMTVLPGPSGFQLVVGSTTAATTGHITVATNTGTVGGFAGTFNFANYNLAGLEKRIATIAGVTVGTLDSGYLGFYTANSGNLNEKMRITAAGLVGIGRTPTTYPLEVQGDVSVTGTYRINGVPIATSQTPWTQDIDGAGFTLKSAGNVGIGNSMAVMPSADVTARLIVGATSGIASGQVVITSNITGAGGGFGGFAWANYAITATDKRIAFIGAATGNTIDSGDVYFYTWNAGAAGERMRITSAGNVGIGTTGPGAPLEVVQQIKISSAVQQSSLSIVGSAATDIGISVAHQGTGGRNWQLLSSGGSSGLGQGTFSIYDASAGSRLCILSSGFCGIGITNPSYQLQLSTDSAAKPGTNAWTVASDERLKRNIQPFTEGLGTILQFDPLAYEYNGLDGTPEGMKAVGLSAQQAMNIYPPMVKSHQGTIAEKEVTVLDLNNSDLTWMMVNAFKQVDLRLKALEGKP